MLIRMQKREEMAAGRKSVAINDSGNLAAFVMEIRQKDA